MANLNIYFHFQSYKADTSVKLRPISGQKIFQSCLEELSQILERKRQALRRLVDAAEQNVVYLDPTYGSMLALEDVPFLNMKLPPPLSAMPFSQSFRQRVSFEESGVHIPLEVFDGCKWKGLCFISYTFVQHISFWQTTWHHL